MVPLKRPKIKFINYFQLTRVHWAPGGPRAEVRARGEGANGTGRGRHVVCVHRSVCAVARAAKVGGA